MSNTDGAAEKKLWLETISAQIERELKLKQSGKLTGIALWGLLLHFIYKSLTVWFPVLYTYGTLFQFFLFSSVFINLAVVLFVAFTQVFNVSLTDRETSLFPRLGEVNMGLIFCSLSLFSLSGLLLNLLSTGIFFLGNGPFVAGSILSVFWFFVFITFFLLWVFSSIDNHSSLTRSIFLPAKNLLDRIKSGQKIRIILYAITGATFFILISKFPTEMNSNLTSNLEVALEFVAMHFVSLVILCGFGINSKLSMLESLEQKILLDRIPTGQIKEEYELTLLGSSFYRWISEAKEQIATASVDLSREIAMSLEKAEKLAKGSKSGQVEVSTQLNSINDDLLKTRNGFEETFTSMIAQIEFAIKIGMFSKHESEIFNELMDIIRKKMAEKLLEADQGCNEFKRLHPAISAGA